MDAINVLMKLQSFGVSDEEILNIHEFVKSARIENARGIGKSYRTKLIPKCSCPFDQEFCKHSITLLLHWIHRREEFLNVDLVLKELRNKSKEELLTLVEESIRMNPDIIFHIKPTQ